LSYLHKVFLQKEEINYPSHLIDREMSLIDPEIAKCIFNQRFINFKLCSKLESVSSLFRQQAENYYQQLKSFKLSSIYSYNSLKQRPTNSQMETLANKLGNHCPNIVDVDLNTYWLETSSSSENDPDPIPNGECSYTIDLSKLSALRSLGFPSPTFDVLCPYGNMMKLDISVRKSTEKSLIALVEKLALCHLRALQFSINETDLSEMNNFVNVVESMKSLKKREIHYFAQNDEDLAKLASMPRFCQILTSLYVRYDDQRAFDQMASIFRAGHLRDISLMVHSGQNVDPEFFFHEIPTLQQLDVDHAYFTTPQYAFNSDFLMNFER